MKKTIGFIGGGRITKIILHALRNKEIALNTIRVFDIDTKTSDKLKEVFPEITIEKLSQVSSADIVFIALHPPAIPETLEKIKADIKPESTIVSLAPKISCEKISSALNNEKVVRMIPGASSIINKGYNPVYYAEGYKKLPELETLFSALGQSFETQEHKLEAYAISSAMLPTYFWFQWEEMIKISKEIGLTEEESRETIKESLLSAVATMFDSDLSFEQVFDLIPVKPIGEHEGEIRNILRSKLTALHAKIKA
jgi:pyrroline-5-carboxylate reductase